MRRKVVEQVILDAIFKGMKDKTVTGSSQDELEVEVMLNQPD